jgi:hypothetical protein
MAVEENPNVKQQEPEPTPDTKPVEDMSDEEFGQLVYDTVQRAIDPTQLRNWGEFMHTAPAAANGYIVAGKQLRARFAGDDVTGTKTAKGEERVAPRKKKARD